MAFNLLIIMSLIIAVTACFFAIAAARALRFYKQRPPSFANLLTAVLVLSVCLWFLTWMIENPAKKLARIEYSQIERELFRKDVQTEVKTPLGEMVCAGERVSLIPLVIKRSPETSLSLEFTPCQSATTTVLKTVFPKTFFESERVLYIPLKEEEIRQLRDVYFRVKDGADVAQLSTPYVTIGASRLKRAASLPEWLERWAFEKKVPEAVLYIRYKSDDETDVIVLDLDDLEKLFNILTAPA